MFKKLLLSFFVFLTITFSFVPFAYAQSERSTWYSQDFLEWYNKVYDSDTSSEIFGERYTAAQVQWVIYGFMSFLIRLPGNEKALECMLQPGIDIGDCSDALKEALENVLGTQSQSQSSVLQIFTMRPISGISYFRDTLSRLKIIPSVHAQGQGGFGFSAANPVLAVWRAARNLTYLLLVLVVVALAFMIMFRVKISPQVVISVQSALPKVAITIILITFSYAIAGFMIDLMYVVLGILSLFVQQSGLSHLNSIAIFNMLTRQGILNMLLAYWILFMAAAVSSIFSGNLISGVVSVFLVILAFLSIILLLWWFIKIIFLLLKTYAMIMISIIAGPIQILLGAVTPSGGGFGAWFRTILSHLAVYPLVATLFMLAFLFLNGAIPDTLISQTADFANPFGFNTAALQGAPWDPPFTFGTVAGSDILWIVLSFVIIALIPKTAEIIQGLISGKPFAYGTAIGEAVGEPGRVAYGAMGVVGGVGKGIEGLRAGGLIGGHPIESSQTRPSAKLEKRLEEIRTAGVETVTR